MAIDVVRRYGPKETFMVAFNPNKQIKYSRHVDRMFIGKAPAIGLVSQAYGQSTAESWIEIQIRDLSEFTGCKDKLDILQIEQTAIAILREYGYLKVTELMYFFFLFKAGRFGRFYGSVDPLVITTSLKEFMKIREKELDRLSKEASRQEKLAEDRENQYRYLTYEEYQELYWLFNMGYETNNLKP